MTEKPLLTPWSGGWTPPCGDDDIVIVRFRDGSEQRGRAAAFLWWHLGGAGQPAAFSACDDDYNDILFWGRV